MPDEMANISGWTFETLRIHFEELLKSYAGTGDEVARRLSIIEIHQQNVMLTMLTKAEYEVHHQELVNKFLVVESRLTGLETEYKARMGISAEARNQRNLMFSMIILLVTSILGILTNLYIHYGEVPHEHNTQSKVSGQIGKNAEDWPWPWKLSDRR